MGWFKKHLNWTYVIFGSLLPFIFVILLRLFAGVSITTSSPITPIIILGLSAIVATNVGFGAWLLSEKGRNPWWILILFTGIIGVIVLLSLKNKSSGIIWSNIAIGRSVIWSEVILWCSFGVLPLPGSDRVTFISSILCGFLFGLLFYGFTMLIRKPEINNKVFFIAFSIIYPLLFILYASHNPYYSMYTDLYYRYTYNSILMPTMLMALVSSILSAVIYIIYKIFRAIINGIGKQGKQSK